MKSKRKLRITIFKKYFIFFWKLPMLILFVALIYFTNVTTLLLRVFTLLFVTMLMSNKDIYGKSAFYKLVQ